MANADGLEHMLNRVMPKDNIGLTALLQTTPEAWDNSKFNCYIFIFNVCLVKTCSGIKFVSSEKNNFLKASYRSILILGYRIFTCVFFCVFYCFKGV